MIYCLSPFPSWPFEEGYINHLGEKLFAYREVMRGDAVGRREGDFFRLVCIRG